MGGRLRRTRYVKSGRRVASRASTTRGWRSSQKTAYRGVVYASKSEARYAAHLDLLKKAGVIKAWEGQVRWALIVGGEKVCTIVPDFRVTLADGSVELHEVKGYATALWKLKRKLFEALYPEVPYIVITAEETKAL